MFQNYGIEFCNITPFDAAGQLKPKWLKANNNAR